MYMWLTGRGITLADTPANQAEYPQPSGQKPGCGFPLMQVVGLLNLGTRALEKVSYSPMNTDEGGMFDVDLLKHLKAGDILMGDRGFFSYVRLAMLANGGVDVVMRLNSAACWPKEITGDEGWVQRRKPSLAQTPLHWTDAEWEALPPTTAIRYVRVRVQRKGFRPQTLYLATTIADISAAELANLYLERWAVELCFDDLKTTLGMDFVPVKSPANGGETGTDACDRSQSDPVGNEPVQPALQRSRCSAFVQRRSGWNRPLCPRMHTYGTTPVHQTLRCPARRDRLRPPAPSTEQN